jgi:microcystin degradation protein MlrC
VLLVETADCCGGGAAGDSVATLRALLERRVAEPALVPVVDPAASAECHRAGAGTRVSIELGHQIDPRWGQPITVTGEVLLLDDGRFHYSGGIWEGQLGEMGPSAVLAIGPVHVLITTHATYDWADEQYRAVGLDPCSAKFVVVKNPMNYRFGYAGIYRAAFILDTPGPTPAILHQVRYRHVQRPYYPADREIPGLEPVVLRGRA